MLRNLTFSVLAILLMLAASCTPKKITASGNKQTAYTKFNFRVNNNHNNRSSIYKRYVAHNRNYKPFPTRSKKVRRDNTSTDKPFLAQNKK